MFETGGNVGIGKTTPNAKLDVDGNAVISGSLSVTSSFAVRGATNFYGVVNSFGTSNSVNIYGGLSTGLGLGSSDVNVDIGVGRSADGNAYLNFVSDTATYPFYGLLAARLSGANGKSQFIHRGTGDFEIKANEAAAISLQTSGTEKVRILSGGNVGIGTTTPGYKLDIRNDVAAGTSLEPVSLGLYNASDAGAAIYFRNGVGGQSKISFGVESTGAGTDDTYLGFSTGQNAALSERMRITSAGNVGIGKVPANAIFDVSGSAAISGSATVTGSFTANGRVTFNNGGTGGNGTLTVAGDITTYRSSTVGIIYFGSNQNNYLYYDGSNYYMHGGNLNLNSSNGLVFNTYGGGWYMSDSTWIRSYGSKNIYHDSGIMRTDGTLQVGGSGGTLNVANGGDFSYRTNVLVANTSGSVGIGTATPNAKLDVNGSAAITGSASVTVSLGVGVVASGTAGEIRATGEIISSYSDDRLKTKLGSITEAIEKIKSLNGFYYAPSDTAMVLGYPKKIDVGISAQEVNKILPEIISPAPIDPQYMTVRYERLIPLLIEAIKEQQNQIDGLKKQIETLNKN
jgi:hypothetical protein